MPILVKKWGNSAAVRIPARVMEAARLALEQPVEVRAEQGRVIIEPVGHHYELDSLLAGISPDNLHGEVDFGAPVGREIC